MDKITVEPGISGLPSIDGIVCTYSTRKIRDMIEGFLKVNDKINLPENYSYEILPSSFWGIAAKIVKLKK